MTQAQTNLKTIPQFEAEYPAFKGRMRWIRWRSQPVRRTRQGNGSDVVVEELKPNGFASAFLEIAGRVYVIPTEFWRIVARQNAHHSSTFWSSAEQERAPDSAR